ncbi:MAG: M20/M25/M40 family metallo-hydrolase [bacterium]
MRRPLAGFAIAMLVAPFLATAHALERPRAGDWLVAAAPPSPDLARRIAGEGGMVVRELEGSVLAVADEATRARLAGVGVPVEALAPVGPDAGFYTVTGSVPLEALRRHGRVLRRDGRETVIEASPEEAAALAPWGHVARVFLRPIRPPAPAPTASGRRREIDVFIQQSVASVDAARITASVQRLQDFRTRFASHDSCGAAAQWIGAQLAACGVDSVSFHRWSTHWHENVVGVARGRSCPESVVVVGGHYDSITGDQEYCPGADDDASGVASLLECARALGEQRYRKTIVYVAFCAEEEGLYGSEAYASEAAARAERIVAMINLDMVGYLEENDSPTLSVISNTGSGWLLRDALTARDRYLGSLGILSGALPGGASSDHASFWAQGYSAILLFEDVPDYSPWIHTLSDVVGRSYNSPLRAREATQLATALVAMLAVPDRGGAADVPVAESAGAGDDALAVSTRPVPGGAEVTLRREGAPAPADVSIVDVAGRHIVDLLRGEVVSGVRSIVWPGRSEDGRSVPEGVYFVRAETGRRVWTSKVLLRRTR